MSARKDAGMRTVKHLPRGQWVLDFKGVSLCMTSMAQLLLNPGLRVDVQKDKGSVYARLRALRPDCFAALS